MSPRALLYDPELRPARDLYDVLDDLLRNDPDGTFTAAQLGAVLGVTRATVQRWAALLEQAGWLERLAQVGQHGGAGYRPLRRPRCLNSGTPGPREASQIWDASARGPYKEPRGREEEEGSAASPAAQPWCGRCEDPHSRGSYDAAGAFTKCRTCHPTYAGPAPF